MKTFAVPGGNGPALHGCWQGARERFGVFLHLEGQATAGINTQDLSSSSLHTDSVSSLWCPAGLGLEEWLTRICSYFKDLFYRFYPVYFVN